MSISYYAKFIVLLFVITFCLLFFIAGDWTNMVGGGLQRACTSTFRRMMPRSQGSQEAEGYIVRGRGLGRGKGGPKGRGRGRPRWRVRRRSISMSWRRRRRRQRTTLLHRLSGCGVPRDSRTGRSLLPYGHWSTLWSTVRKFRSYHYFSFDHLKITINFRCYHY